MSETKSDLIPLLERLDELISKIRHLEYVSYDGEVQHANTEYFKGRAEAYKRSADFLTDIVKAF